MNGSEDILEGKWKQLRGRVKEAWGVLTDDEIDQVGGKRDRLVGLLQEKLGYTRMQADQEIDRLLADLDRST